MGFLDFFKPININKEVERYKQTASSALVDVREADEFRLGHIAGSKNLPLSMISKAPSTFPKKDQPLFVYCQSGGRSSQAVSALKRMGYTNVFNIGGIILYRGKLVR